MQKDEANKSVKKESEVAIGAPRHNRFGGVFVKSGGGENKVRKISLFTS
jgi:hypothetical protein